MRDRDALVALYCVTGGMNWRSNRNWLAEKPVGQWHGVTTDRAGRVTGLDLGENNLRGVIPPEIGNLGSLEQVFLDGNELTGAIPPELGSLARLDWLGLSGNELTGAIPPQLGSLSSLVALGLGDNNLTGAIPRELGRLGSLQDLWLGANNLTGVIPPELGNLRSLVWLGLGENNLTGAAPVELGNLHNLETLSFQDNELTGPLPLSLAGLERLDGFSYFNTGLCVPDDEVLRAWLQSLRVHRGTGVDCAHWAQGGDPEHPSEPDTRPYGSSSCGSHLTYPKENHMVSCMKQRLRGARGNARFYWLMKTFLFVLPQAVTGAEPGRRAGRGRAGPRGVGRLMSLILPLLLFAGMPDRVSGQIMMPSIAGLAVAFDAAEENVLITWTQVTGGIPPIGGDHRLELEWCKKSTCLEADWGGVTNDIAAANNTEYAHARQTEHSAGSSHKYRIRVRHLGLTEVGNWANSAAFEIPGDPVVTAPAPPTGVRLTIADVNSLSLSVVWTAADPATGITSYEVQSQKDAEGWALAGVVAATETLTLAQSALVRGSTYAYRVFSRTEATACPLDGTAATHCSTPAPDATGVEYEVPLLPPAADPPDPPTGVAVTAATDNDQNVTVS